MAIKYNPYGWEIRPVVSEGEKRKKKRNHCIEMVNNMIKEDVYDERKVTFLLCKALEHHEKMIRCGVDRCDTALHKQIALKNFNDLVDDLYRLRYKS